MADKIRIAEIETAYTSNLKGLEQGAARAERIVKDSARNINQTLGSIGSGTGGASFFDRMLSVAGGNLLSTGLSYITGGFKDAVKAGFEFNDLMERAQIGMETMTGSAKTAQKHLSELVKFATFTPFSTSELVQYSQRLQAVGFAAKDIIPILRATGDAVAGLGGDPEQLERIVRAIGDIKTRGKVQAEEIRQLANAGIPAWQWIAEGAGTTTRKAQELAEGGRLDANKTVELLIMKMNERYGGMMERMQGTMSAQVNTFFDLLQQRSGQVGYPAFQGAKGVLGTVNKGLAGDFSLSDLSGYLTGMMGQVGSGISGGFNMAIDAAKEQGKKLGLNLQEGTEEALEIKSPSRVYYRIGLMAGTGFQLGFKQAMQESGQPLDSYLNDPRVRALLEVIKTAEGGDERTLYGGGQWGGSLGQFPQWSGKKFYDNKAKKWRTTHAAGSYQFQPGTYAGIGQEFGLPGDFTQRSQDLHAIGLLKKIGALDKLFSQGFNATIPLLGSQWASIPGNLPGNKLNPHTLEKMYARSLASGAYQDPLQIPGLSLAQTAPPRGMPIPGMNMLDISPSNPVPVRLVDIEGGGVRFPMGSPDEMDRAGGFGDYGTPAISSAALMGMMDVNKILPSVAHGRDLANDFLKLSIEAPKIAGGFDDAGDSMSRFGKLALDAKGRVSGLIVESEEAGQRLKVSWDDVAGGFENTFMSAFDSIADEGLAGFGRNMLTGFARLIAQLTAQAAAANLSRALFGFTGEKGSAGGGIFSSIFGAILGAFGGGGGGSNFSSAGASITSGFAGGFAGGFATGGYVPPGKWAIAGERGAEPIFAGRAGLTVVPNSRTGSVTNVFNLNFKTEAPNSYYPKRSESEFAQGVANYMQKRFRR